MEWSAVASREIVDQDFIGNFWDLTEEWLAYAPDFNTNRVATPALFTAHGAGDQYPAESLRTIGAFRLNARPFEFIFFPNGSHPLIRPREKVAFGSVIVDWVAFWLNGEVDRDPAKAEMYARWNYLKFKKVNPELRNYGDTSLNPLIQNASIDGDSQ